LLAGGTVEVTDFTRSDNAAGVGASTTEFYLITGTTLDSSAVPIGSRGVDPLPASTTDGGSLGKKTTLTLPATMAGMFRIIAKADAGNKVSEINEDNNVSGPSAVFTLGPDLVAELDVPGDAKFLAEGASISVTAIVRNNGLTKAPPSTVELYYSAVGTFDGSAVAVGSRGVRELGPKEQEKPEEPRSIGFTLPGGDVGRRYLYVKADASGAVLEYDEGNNVSAPQMITIGPDLTILGISVPRRSDPGAKTVTVSDVTKNLGAGSAPMSRTGFYLSRDAVLDAGDVLLGSRTINPLSGRETNTDETTVDIPATTMPGCHFIIASADDERAVQEFDETNNAPREVARPIQIGFPGRTLACAATDFNFDLKSDILWRHSEGAAGIWIMNGAGVVSTAVPATPTLEWEIAGTGDFNADGRMDVLWRDTESGAVGIWLMDLTGTSIASMAVPASPPLEWVVQGVGDFNGDGKADILWRETSSGAVGIWIMNGTSITSIGEPARPPLDWVIQGVGDFNLDNKADILWRETSSGAVGIWLMDGTTLVSTAIPATPPLEWAIQGVGDFNGDAKADILWRETSSGAVGIWLMDGTTLVSTAIPASPPLEWVIQGVGDFNGDGRADILWREGDGALAIWLMDGVEIRSMAAPAFVGPPATPISVGPEWTIE
jgi:hypothetical protein